MNLDTYTLALFSAGLLAGVGVMLTAETTPGFVVAARIIYHYGRQHPGWGIGFALLVVATELAAAAILFGI